MKSWQLPDYISDILPPKAHQLEQIKGQILALFATRGYQLVAPPLIEYIDSLLANQDEGLRKKTLQLTDQLSGQQIGVRADITTQIARLDSHLSSPGSIKRFCYAGPVLYALPQSLIGTREPLQIGAEIFGHRGVGADIEIIELMLDCAEVLPVKEPMLSISHIDIVSSLLEEAKIPYSEATEIMRLLMIKDQKGLEAELEAFHLTRELKDSFLALTNLYGPEKVLAKAQKALIMTPRVKNALEEIERISRFFKKYPIYIDLAELRADRYHTGLLYGIYADGWSNLIARGGRYDKLETTFGHSRPATGFSMDLKDFLALLPTQKTPTAIKVKVADYEAARDAIALLRKKGETVIIEYGRQGKIEGIVCDRELVYQDHQWVVQSLRA